MISALDDGDGGYQRQLGVLLEVGDVRHAYVAHGGLDLVQGRFHVVPQGTGVGDVGVHAFLKAELGRAAQIVALPVPGAVGAFAPVFLHVRTVDHDLVRGAFVEAGEVTAQHQEVRAHGQRQRHVVIVDNAAVGADGHVDARLLEILVTGCGDLDQCRCLTTANALGFTGNADGAAADADLHKVRPGFRQKTESVLIHHVAGADLHGVAVGVPHPFDGLFLPAGVALGGVDHQHVRTGLQQGGNAGGVVTGVDARAYQIALLVVQQLQGIVLVGGVVLPEHEIQQVVILVHDGQAVELVLPDDVIGFLQRGVRGSGDQLLTGGHEVLDLVGGVHTADAVVTAGDDAQQLTVGGAVLGDCHGGEAVALLQRQHVGEGSFRGQIGSGGDETGLIALHPCHHGGLILDGLRAVNEADAALLCQRDGKGVVGDGLHDGGRQRHIQGNCRFLRALAVLDEGRFQADMVGNAVFRGVAGNQKILAEGVAGFRVVIRHWYDLL